LLCLTLPGEGHAQQPVLCPGETVPLDISAASKPFVRMRLGGHEGNFLIDTGATGSRVDAGLFGVTAGSKITLGGSSLPTLDGGAFDAVDMSPEQPFAPAGGHAGTIGADILSTRTVEFHYESASPYLVLSAQRCGGHVFEAAGFVPILQRGFGASGTWLSRLTSWWFASRAGITDRANLPIIYARIGAVSAPLWLDSGWGLGATRHMLLLINDAILARLRDAGVAMKGAGGVINSDCQGNRGEDALWQVEREPLIFTTEDGTPLFESGPPTLQLRGKSPCGTIGNWPEPIGTVGALFLPRWSTVVLDGPNQRVWVRKVGTVVPARDAFRGIAFARGDNGGWSLSIRDAREEAHADSLKSCNERQLGCRVEATVESSAFGCLAVAKKPNVGLPAPATAGALAAARDAARAACESQNGAGCELVYAGCND
jgi:hypothetical protein